MGLEFNARARLADATRGTQEGDASIHLDRAETAATPLAAPLKTRLEKMGIHSGCVVTVLNIDDAQFGDEVLAVGATIHTRLKKHAALIVRGVNVANDLTRIETARRSMADNGALWVVHLKGVVGVKDADIVPLASRAK